jgi:hypothetical protein
MRANPPMIRFLAAIGYTVHKVRPLVYNPKQIKQAEDLREELRKITGTTRGLKDG